MFVQLAIENDNIAGGFIAHRLRAGLRKIDNGQPRVIEGNPTIYALPYFHGIWPPMGHLLHRIRRQSTPSH